MNPVENQKRATDHDRTGSLTVWGYNVDPACYDPLDLNHRRLLATFPITKGRYETINVAEYIRHLRELGQLTIPVVEIAAYELSFQ